MGETGAVRKQGGGWGGRRVGGKKQTDWRPQREGGRGLDTRRAGRQARAVTAEGVHPIRG